MMTSIMYHLHPDVHFLGAAAEDGAALLCSARRAMFICGMNRSDAIVDVWFGLSQSVAVSALIYVQLIYVILQIFF